MCQRETSKVVRDCQTWLPDRIPGEIVLNSGSKKDSKLNILPTVRAWNLGSPALVLEHYRLPVTIQVR